MISHPGDIAARFGRYEAIESIGPVERAQLWRAWDPFLERFVVVAALPDVDPQELHRTMPELQTALNLWLGGESPRSVLDFGPGSRNQPAYFIFPMPDLEAANTSPDTEVEVRPTKQSLGKVWSDALRLTYEWIAEAGRRLTEQLQGKASKTAERANDRTEG